ncbi:hypothetical protein V8C35DRAFT_91806 [Trichoderma chlorosporum]
MRCRTECMHETGTRNQATNEVHLPQVRSPATPDLRKSYEAGGGGGGPAERSDRRGACWTSSDTRRGILTLVRPVARLCSCSVLPCGSVALLCSCVLASTRLIEQRLCDGHGRLPNRERRWMRRRGTYGLVGMGHGMRHAAGYRCAVCQDETFLGMGNCAVCDTAAMDRRVESVNPAGALRHDSNLLCTIPCIVPSQAVS